MSKWSNNDKTLENNRLKFDTYPQSYRRAGSPARIGRKPPKLVVVGSNPTPPAINLEMEFDWANNRKTCTAKNNQHRNSNIKSEFNCRITCWKSAKITFSLKGLEEGKLGTEERERSSKNINAIIFLASLLYPTEMCVLLV